jgi:hypothetical protein
MGLQRYERKASKSKGIQTKSGKAQKPNAAQN